VANLLRASTAEVVDRVGKMIRHQKELEREIETLKGKLAAKESGDMIKKVRSLDGLKVLATTVEASDVKALRDFGDKLRDKMLSGIILLGSKVGDKAMLLCMVTKDLTARYDAGRIVKEIAPIVGGSGGGRPDMAQAGGTRPENLEKALDKLIEMLGGEKEPEKKPTPKKPMSTATEAVVTGPKSRKTVEARRQKPLKKRRPERRLLKPRRRTKKPSLRNEGRQLKKKGLSTEQSGKYESQMDSGGNNRKTNAMTEEERGGVYKIAKILTQGFVETIDNRR